MPTTSWSTKKTNHTDNCWLTIVVPRPAQPSIPLGSVNEDQLWLGKQRQIWFNGLILSKHVGTRQNCTWVLLWRSCLINRCYIKCPLPLHFNLYVTTCWLHCFWLAASSEHHWCTQLTQAKELKQLPKAVVRLYRKVSVLTVQSKHEKQML